MSNTQDLTKIMYETQHKVKMRNVSLYDLLTILYFIFSGFQAFQMRIFLLTVLEIDSAGSLYIVTIPHTHNDTKTVKYNLKVILQHYPDE